jgi:hypothetical protein
MSLQNPITGPTRLRRWPFQRRPVVQPGSTHVFQRSSGGLVSAGTGMTASDVTLRGLQQLYEVDIRAHGASFDCTLPSRNTALLFNVTTTYSWRVDDPLRVVHEKVFDAPATCKVHLMGLMRRICRRFDEHQEELVEIELNDALINPIPLTDSGLVITAVTIDVRSDRDVLDLGRERYTQAGALELHKLRVSFFGDIVASGSLVANILAQDPHKAEEAALFVDRQLQADRQVAIDAMKILVEGDAIRYGEIDDAVVAVVERFRAIVTQPQSIAQQASQPPAVNGQSSIAIAATADPSTPDGGTQS